MDTTSAISSSCVLAAPCASMSHRFTRSFTASINGAGFVGDGSKKPANAAVDIIGSPPPARKCWPRKEKVGAISSKQSDVSPECNMPDFKNEIRTRLASFNLPPTRELEIVEELSQHLEDEYEEALTRGASEADAAQTVLGGLGDLLGRELKRVERRAPQTSLPPGTRQKSSFVADVIQDMRFAVRMFSKNPAFT